MKHKPVARLCERIIKDGKMWCNTHDRPHFDCRVIPPHLPKEITLREEEIMEVRDGKILAPGNKRTFTPSEN